MLMALINKGFDMLDAHPFHRESATGGIMVAAPPFGAGKKRR